MQVLRMTWDYQSTKQAIATQNTHSAVHYNITMLNIQWQPSATWKSHENLEIRVSSPLTFRVILGQHYLSSFVNWVLIYSFVHFKVCNINFKKCVAVSPTYFQHKNCTFILKLIDLNWGWVYCQNKNFNINVQFLCWK